MEVPDVVRARLDGDETVYASVPLGDEDVACLTRSGTFVYRGEGLLSDESVETYPHSVERLSLSRGRRKAKFVFEYVDGTRTLKVPGDRADPLLERVLEAVFREGNVIGADESVVGSFRFSELTVVVTERRLVKRIGEAVWGDDFEAYRFADVTGLDFEPGSVATQIVIEADGRRQRIKAPNDEAPLVKRALTNALFDFYDVRNIDAFRATVGERASSEADEGAEADADFGSGIDPLVEEGSDEAAGEWSMDQARAESQQPERTGDDVRNTHHSGDRGGTRPPDSHGDDGRTGSSAEQSADAATNRDEWTETPLRDHEGQPEPATKADIAAVTEQLSELTEAVERQNELIEKQHRALQRLL